MLIYKMLRGSTVVLVLYSETIAGRMVGFSAAKNSCFSLNYLGYNDGMTPCIVLREEGVYITYLYSQQTVIQEDILPLVLGTWIDYYDTILHKHCRARSE